ncbi:hypothetical protein KFK09_015391 [Dendrobium nobile]|uniref:Uncharacterized protein n=1 Tax=Dendrobium nobile TaxID=94219 RepID=A0A8T3B6M4_DENNO|nr:hypothetical protein KFK09_015391 [Dendrobium nobile]
MGEPRAANEGALGRYLKATWALVRGKIADFAQDFTGQRLNGAESAGFADVFDRYEDSNRDFSRNYGSNG